MKRDADEKELLESVERGEWKFAASDGACHQRYNLITDYDVVAESE